MPRKTRVLYILHNHPSLHPGGPETYALELYEAMRGSDEFEPTLVARMGSDAGVARRERPGAPFSMLNGDPSQFLVYIPKEGFDFFNVTYGEKSMYTRYFADFLRTHEPDVVHFHHSLYVGCELISLVRYLLPAAPIVYTLHDYTPICHRDGKLVRTVSESLCLEASPLRCHECFPAIADEDFFLRERFIKAHFNHVDVFLAPSRFLLERYADWGIPREKIRLEENGRPPVERSPERSGDRALSPRARLGFFGELGPYDGLDVLLDAMRILGDEAAGVHLWLHGGNLWKYPADHERQLAALLERAGENVTVAGEYERADVPHLMSQVDWVVVPSRWWESSPLAVQDAFLHGRPVICSGIGSMAEKVADGVNGLHFPAGDSRALADTIRDAVATPDTWARLRDGIPPVHPMAEHVDELTNLYRRCLDSVDHAQAPALG